MTGKITRLAETGYTQTGTGSQAYIRFSTDEGKTWSRSIKVPQWRGANEVNLFRAGNGDLLAACRTDIPRQMKGKTLDHYAGLGISISKDDGSTWSGKRKGETYWWPSSQATCSTLLPDGAILTAFGTGYRIPAGKQSPQAPRDAGLVEWRLNTCLLYTSPSPRDRS